MSRQTVWFQLRELEQELLEAKHSGQHMEATRADLEAQLAAAREERDLLVAREAVALAAVAEAEAQSAGGAAEATRQVCMRSHRVVKQRQAVLDSLVYALLSCGEKATLKSCG